MKRFPITMLGLALLLASALPAYAHEFLVVPQYWNTYTAGQELPISLGASHVFMKSEELEDAASVQASYLGKQVPLKADEAFKSYTGVVTLKGGGAAVIRGHRLGEIWSKTPKGILKGDRAALPGVIWSRKYEKFSKTLLAVDGKTEGWNTVVGDDLEIVPLNNPLALKPGDILKVRILHKGKPVSPEAVTATYDGFTDLPNTYACFTEPYGEGEAALPISAPGLWMVRVQYAVNEKGGNYEQHVMRATLVFPVRGAAH